MSEEFWVMDFGGLKEVKDWLAHMFDHTFLIADNDPYLDNFKKMDEDGIIQLRVMPNPGMEGSAKYIYDHVNSLIDKSTNGRVWVTKVEVRENQKNSAFFKP
ncbi:MAG: 6-pyruvoyltetrahydropterin/6-carboxytetrahydropterin synthase [Bacteriovoracaceae bacterium]|jgi:6-pyruvoyltetrahydropterin/6-carboxytetrahydropterin synthase